MRQVAILLCVLLAACATPQTAPEAFYEGVYAPGNATISEDGAFTAFATVLSAENAAVARKAAYARLELAAQENGFSYFTIDGEDEARRLGFRFTVAGQLFEDAASDADVYPLSAIARLINGLPVRTLKEIAEERRLAEAERARQASAERVRRQRASGQAAAPVERVPAPRPASEPLPDAEEPLVIMAPEDITGSIRKPTVLNPTPGMMEPLPFKSSIEVETTAPAQQRVPSLPGTPEALQGVPSGVITR